MTTENVNVNPEFGKLRKIFFPIQTYELKKALPMSIIFFFVIFNYYCVRNVKDALVVTAPNSGAEVISFLKGYCVTPAALLFLICYAKASDMMSNEKLFYATLSPFIVFFGLFAWVIYPNLELLHPSSATIIAWQTAHPAWHWPLAIVGNWSYALFYILAELWGSVIVSLSFWQFANQICKMTEAKRFYAFFGLLGQASLMIAGPIITYFSMPSNLGTNLTDYEVWGITLKWLMTFVFIGGLIIMGLYRWIYTNVLTDKRFYDKPELPGAGKKKSSMSLGQSLKIMVTSPYLALIVALVVCYGITANLIEGLWKSQLKIAYSDTNAYNAFMGQYTFWTGVFSFLIVIVGGNIIRMFSWFTSAVITPLLAFVAGLIFFAFILFRDSLGSVMETFGASPVMMAVMLGATLLVFFKSTKYAMFDWTKEMAYIPLDNEMKVKGKAVVDVVGGRFGKAGGAWTQSLLLLGVGALTGRKISLIEVAPYMAVIFIVACAAWIWAVSSLSKRLEAVTAKK